MCLGRLRWVAAESSHAHGSSDTAQCLSQRKLKETDVPTQRKPYRTATLLRVVCFPCVS